ncbi:MAG: hypothetical protein ACRECG_06165 [Bradyrhizobium sp.]
MCDYSLHTVASRPAKAGDMLVTTSFNATQFNGTISRGFCAEDEPDVAVCLMPGTEVAFATEPTRHGVLAPLLLWLGVGRIGSKLARFRKVNLDYQAAHHDALEFSNGKIVLVTALRRGLEATVLQLPVMIDGDSSATKHNSISSQSPERAEA